MIADNALGVGVINRLADTNARILKATQKMQLPLPGLLPTAQLFTGVQQGLDYKGTLAVALFSVDDEDAESSVALAIFVPTTDYPAMVKQLHPDDADAEIAQVTVAGGEYVVAKKGDFAVFVSAEQKDVLKAILASSHGVKEAVEPFTLWINEQQIAIVATPQGKKLLFEKVGGFLETGPTLANWAAKWKTKTPTSGPRKRR